MKVEFYYDSTVPRITSYNVCYTKLLRMRIFGDCIDEETRGKLLSGYTEYWTEKELRAFAKEFVPMYTEYAVAELEEKKRDGERRNNFV